MRKIISPGLLVLIFSLISGQALAGNAPYCEANKHGDVLAACVYDVAEIFHC